MAPIHTSSIIRREMSSETLLRFSEPPAGGKVLEAGHLNYIEIDVPHEVRGGRVGRLQTLEKHVVAGAVRLAVEGVVGEVVASGEGADLAGTQVVRAAAAVQGPVGAQVVVVRRDVARPAPFSACTKHEKSSSSDES